MIRFSYFIYREGRIRRELSRGNSCSVSQAVEKKWCISKQYIPAGEVRGIRATVMPLLRLLTIKLIYLVLESLVYKFLFSGRRDRRGEGRFLPFRVTGYD
jgi:hypothetical protein